MAREALSTCNSSYCDERKAVALSTVNVFSFCLGYTQAHKDREAVLLEQMYWQILFTLESILPPDCRISWQWWETSLRYFSFGFKQLTEHFVSDTGQCLNILDKRVVQSQQMFKNIIIDVPWAVIAKIWIKFKPSVNLVCNSTFNFPNHHKKKLVMRKSLLDHIVHLLGNIKLLSIANISVLCSEWLEGKRWYQSTTKEKKILLKLY